MSPYKDPEYHKKYYQRNREKLIARASVRAKANRESVRAAGRKWAAKKKLENPEYFRLKSRRRYQENPELGAASARKYRRNLREEMLQAYGNCCACCGEAEPVFLTLEHKQRDGKQHRLAVGNTSQSVLADLRRRGWPKDNYEILCFNCNRGAWALGTCPHRLKGEADNG